MRINSVRALWFAGSLCAFHILPSVAAVSPVSLAFEQGGQFSLNISSTNPNMIFIPGDTVTAISGPEGLLIDKRQTSSGGVIFSTTSTKPFTLFIETLHGQALSVAAVPVKGSGRVYRLLSGEPVARPDVREREAALPYETLLLTLNRAAAMGKMPEGYGVVEPGALAINTFSGLRLSPETAWAGDTLRVDCYRVENVSSSTMALKEQQFWQRGVRSVMFENNARSLMPGTALRIWVVSGIEGARHG